MTSAERMSTCRTLLSEIHQAQMAAAVRVADLQELMAKDEPREVRSPSLPHLEQDRFAVRWKRRRCDLGHTTSFRLIARLLRRPNHYVSYDYLLQDVWNNAQKSDHTIRSAVRELRRKLAQAGMTQLASCIRAQGRHYGLIFVM